MPAPSAPTESSGAQTSIGRELALHLLVLIGLPVSALVAAAIWQDAYAGGVAAFIGCALSMWGPSPRHPKWLGWACFLGFVISLGLANEMADASYVLGGKSLWDLPVQYAADHPSVTLFTFRDAKLRTEQRHTHRVTRTIKRKQSVATITVAPLVREGAPPDQEITAWVVAEAGSQEESRWSAPRHTGVRVRPDDWPRAAAQPALAAAEVRYGLKTRPGAPLLRWRVEPQAAESADVYEALGWSGLAIAGYFLLFMGWLGVLRLRGRLRS